MENMEEPSQVATNKVLMESSHGSPKAQEHICSVFLPEVDSHLKPFVGMTFKELKDASTFYKLYGKAGGFDVRSSSTKYSTKVGVDRVLIEKAYVCSKAGVTNSKSIGRRRTGSGRTNCKALMRLKLDGANNLWIVKYFVEQHNHDFVTPRRRHILRANRIVNNAKKKLLHYFADSNIPTCKTVSYLQNECGGYDKLGCTEIDIRNYQRDIREVLKGHDAQMLMDYFKFSKEKNSKFYYDYKVDADNKLKYCFWADAIARQNFEYFGDIVTFDTTQNTNQFLMLWAPFIGINHHRQTIFLGCGFLRNESAEAFSWIFERFKEAMGRAPRAMVTDQDLGINTAREKKFSSTRHRYCIWHITNKVPEKLGVWTSNKEFMTSFNDCIWNSETPAIFEEKWEKMLENGPSSNEWLQSIYMIREKWAPAYHKMYFWAGITSSQRSEGMNSLLKRNVSCHNTLHDFAMIFERALSRQREQELLEDHMSIEKKPKLKSKWAMEKQMSEIYTRNNFYRFQTEVENSLLNNVEKFNEDASIVQYRVTSCGDSMCSKVVTHTKLTMITNCSCLLFEFNGIPCQHLLAYFRHRYVNYLPDEYIMARWTRDIKRGIMEDSDGNFIKNNNQHNFSSRFSELTHMARKLIDEGLHSDATYGVARKLMQDALIAIRNTKNEEVSIEEHGEFQLIKRMTSSQVVVLEPDTSKTKGRIHGKRMKPARENPKKRSRKCNNCGQRGQNHDYRNCPLRIMRHAHGMHDEQGASSGEEDSGDDNST